MGPERAFRELGSRQRSHRPSTVRFRFWEIQNMDRLTADGLGDMLFGLLSRHTPTAARLPPTESLRLVRFRNRYCRDRRRGHLPKVRSWLPGAPPEAPPALGEAPGK